MTRPGETVSKEKVTLTCSFSVEGLRKLNSLSEQSGMSRSALAAALLEELLPTVTGVRTRLQITRAPTNGGAPR